MDSSTDPDIPTTGGDAVIYAVCRAAAIDRTEIVGADGRYLDQSEAIGTVTVWHANAAEQIEAALAEVGYEIRKISPIKENLH